MALTPQEKAQVTIVAKDRERMRPIIQSVITGLIADFGQAKVARSARIVSPEGEMTESGYGLMFIAQDEEFREMIRRKLMPL